MGVGGVGVDLHAGMTQICILREPPPAMFFFKASKKQKLTLGSTLDAKVVQY